MRIVVVTFVAVFVASILSCPLHAAIHPEALILALPLDEGDGDVAFDVSGRGNDGKLRMGRGGEPFDEWGPGKFGSAVKFEGPSHVEVPNNDAFDLSKTDFTLALWFLFTREPATTFLLNHYSHRGGEKTGWRLYHSGGRFVFQVITAGEKAGWTRSDFFEEPELKRWYHIAMTRVGELYSFYLDGETFREVNQEAPIAEAALFEDPIAIGARVEPFWQGGLCDSVVISREAWTQDDVRRHVNGGIAGVLAVEPAGKLASTWAGIKARGIR